MITESEGSNKNTKIKKNKPTARKKPEKAKPTIKSISDIEVARKMINIAQSATDRKLKYNLSFNTVKKLMLAEKCYYSDKKFTEDGMFARSFDRIDSDLGYVEGNVVACTVDFNGKKSNLTLGEIEILYNKIVKPARNKTAK